MTTLKSKFAGNNANTQRPQSTDAVSEYNPIDCKSETLAIKQEPVEQQENNNNSNTVQVSYASDALKFAPLVPVNNGKIQPGNFVIPQPLSNVNFIPVSGVPGLPMMPLANPTLANPPASAAALQALQQSLKTIQSASNNQNNAAAANTQSNSSSNKVSGLPLPPSMLLAAQQQQQQYPPSVTGFDKFTVKDQKLAEVWSAKLAYAATLSSIINETSKLYRESAELALKPNWGELLYKLNSGKNRDSDKKEKVKTEANAAAAGDESKQKVFDQAIFHIFEKLESFLNEIAATMYESKIVEAIGMMKGLTDGVCNLIHNASIHLPNCAPLAMRQLFENKLLIMWCSLLLRATSDVREAMQRYLSSEAFRPYFDYKTALNFEFYKHLSSDEKLLVSLRTDREQADFEANTQKYVEEANASLVAVQKITVLPQSDGALQESRKRVRFHADGADAHFAHLDGNKEQPLDVRKPPKKRRKKSRFQLFRVDGTPRKRQQNPCDRRVCKRMWQSDGVSRGCGENSHPRGVCACWKSLGFAKEDEKNGNILAWLEKKYGKKYAL